MVKIPEPKQFLVTLTPNERFKPSRTIPFTDQELAAYIGRILSNHLCDDEYEIWVDKKGITVSHTVEPVKIRRVGLAEFPDVDKIPMEADEIVRQATNRILDMS